MTRVKKIQKMTEAMSLLFMFLVTVKIVNWYPCHLIPSPLNLGGVGSMITWTGRDLTEKSSTPLLMRMMSWLSTEVRQVQSCWL